MPHRLAPGSPQALALAHVAARSAGSPLGAPVAVTLNFHPDRLCRGVPILRALARDGIYRSQFETGTSNGGLTAHEGGDRWRWESAMFGGAYDGAAPHERPKYGALDLLGRSTGAAPRFGSAHLRLKSDVAARCTFCYPDSVFGPDHFGILDRMDRVAQASRQPMDDPLDDYIEVHVHGPIDLARDVDALVLDPCFRGTEVDSLARLLPCAVEWHAGFRLPVAMLRRYPDYRGQRYIDLAAQLASDGMLDPACLGRAARDGDADPQDLKKVWHYLARFGDPARPSAAAEPG
jgi:hypothetical protein